MNTYLVLKGYQDRAVWISRRNAIRFFVCGVGWSVKFTKERWICWDEFLA